MKREGRWQHGATVLPALNFAALAVLAILIGHSVWMAKRLTRAAAVTGTGVDEKGLRSPTGADSGISLRNKSRAGWWVRNGLPCVLAAGAWWGSGLWELNPNTRVVGFPFTAGVLELHDGRWFDYVGPITAPAMIGNFLFWFLLSRLPILWWLRQRVRGVIAS